MPLYTVGAGRSLIYATPPVVAAAAATTWNPSDKDADLTLSNGNLTWEGTNRGSVRTIATLTSNQKVYFEVVVVALGDSFGWNIGIADATLSVGAAFSGFGTSPSHSGGVSEDGQFRCADSGDHTTNVISSFTTGDNIGVSFNSATGKIWFRKNGGSWNNLLSTQDPAAGTGGVAIPFSGSYYAVGGGEDLHAKQTAKFSSADWTYSAPSGFTQLAA